LFYRWLIVAIKLYFFICRYLCQARDTTSTSNKLAENL
jgi:hypothetical protein